MNSNFKQILFLNYNRFPNRSFELYHAWHILKYCLKLNDQFQSLMGRSSQHSKETINSINSEDDSKDVVMAYSMTGGTR